MMFLLVMVKQIPIFNIFITHFLHCVLQTLNEVASVEITKNSYRGNYPKAKKGGQFWFIRSYPFLTPVTGIKIDNTAELYDRAVIITFK